VPFPDLVVIEPTPQTPIARESWNRVSLMGESQNAVNAEKPRFGGVALIDVEP
jgi:hypothetical protein